MHVFISYSREDSLFANLIKTALESRGHKVWMDSNDIKGGDQWRQEIDDALYGAYIMVLVLSPDAHTSPYVTYEWSFALAIGTPIIPVMVRKIDDMHPRLGAFQCLDFSRQPNPDWKELIDDLDGKIDQIPFTKIRSFYGFRSSLRDRRQILSYTGKKTFYQYIGGLVPTERGFRLVDEDWALQCNSAFWQWLSNHQNEHHDESMQALATHTASPIIWLSEGATDSLNQQKAFVEGGGKIARVFIGPFASPSEGDSTYEKAMVRMHDFKIDAFYVAKPDGDNNLDDYTWIPCLGILQTWTSRTMFGDQIQVVDLAETDEVLREAQNKYWNKLKSRAVDLRGRALASCDYVI